MTHSQWELLFYAFTNKGLSVDSVKDDVATRCLKRGWLEEKEGVLRITLRGRMKAEELIPFGVA